MNEGNKDAKWPQGMIFKKPREGAPDFVKGHISFKVEEAVPWLQANVNNGWVNVDIKKSKEGKLYLQLNEWKKEASENSDPGPQEEF